MCVCVCVCVRVCVCVCMFMCTSSFVIHSAVCRIPDKMLVFAVSEKSVLTEITHPGSNVTE